MGLQIVAVGMYWPDAVFLLCWLSVRCTDDDDNIDDGRVSVSVLTTDNYMWPGTPHVVTRPIIALMGACEYQHECIFSVSNTLATCTCEVGGWRGGKGGLAALCCS